MSKILISINPIHVAKILSGEKKYEYRTRVAKKDVDTLLIYETTPIKKVVAEAKVISILGLPPEELWNKTKDHSGISKEFFDEYFRNRHIAYAYQLGEIRVFETTRELSHYGAKTAPQSFIYIL